MFLKLEKKNLTESNCFVILFLLLFGVLVKYLRSLSILQRPELVVAVLTEADKSRLKPLRIWWQSKEIKNQKATNVHLENPLLLFFKQHFLTTEFEEVREVLVIGRSFSLGPPKVKC